MTRPKATRKSNRKAAVRLLAWYDSNRRVLPWRAEPGVPADPYRVWLSEVMLQQTTARAVVPYYLKFLERWPSLKSLADAPLDEVLAAWSGLGYYARARNLHRAARLVDCEFQGLFPKSPAKLRSLPGVGQYSAAAISAIAFDGSEIAMDANAQRVIARYFGVRVCLPQAGGRLRVLGQSLVPSTRNGDFVQAMMDLGHDICTSRSPRCSKCPLCSDCRARALGLQAILPAKQPRRIRPIRRGAAFVAVRADGAVLLNRRPESGLLGGMLQPPLGPWSPNFPVGPEILRQAPFPAVWTKRAGIVRHTFTHFELEIEVYRANVTRSTAVGFGWRPRNELPGAPLPSVMRKIIAHGLGDEAPGEVHTRSARRR